MFTITPAEWLARPITLPADDVREAVGSMTRAVRWRSGPESYYEGSVFLTPEKWNELDRFANETDRPTEERCRAMLKLLANAVLPPVLRTLH